MARKSQTRPASTTASTQSDVAFAQLMLVTMQIYGNRKHCSQGARKAR